MKEIRSRMKDKLFSKHNGERSTRERDEASKGGSEVKMKQQEGHMGWRLLRANRIESGGEGR